MERLTNVGSSGEIWITDNDETRKFGCKESAYKKLAEYENFEERGLLIHLRCKPGDLVYCIEDREIWECIVNKISISRLNCIWIEVEMPKSMPDISAIEYTEADFGKTVFLTQTEAEQKLKESKGN